MQINNDILNLHPIVAQCVQQVAWTQSMLACVDNLFKNATTSDSFWHELSPERLHFLVSQIIKNSIAVSELSACSHYSTFLIYGQSLFERSQADIKLDVAFYLIEYLSANDFALEQQAQYNVIVNNLCERGNLQDAFDVLECAKWEAEHSKSKSAKAHYYHTKCQYLDYLLDGNYDASDADIAEGDAANIDMAEGEIAEGHIAEEEIADTGVDEEAVRREFVKSLKKVIKLLRTCDCGDDIALYAESLLGLATIYIRGGDYSKKIVSKIDTLIDDAGIAIDTLSLKTSQNTTTHQRLNLILCLVRAWYAAFITCNTDQVERQIKCATSHFSEFKNYDALDSIDDFYIPVANIYFEIKDPDSASKYLNEAIKICDDHKDIDMYIAKKQQLKEYLSQVKGLCIN